MSSLLSNHSSALLQTVQESFPSNHHLGQSLSEALSQSDSQCLLLFTVSLLLLALTFMSSYSHRSAFTLLFSLQAADFLSVCLYICLFCLHQSVFLLLSYSFLLSLPLLSICFCLSLFLCLYQQTHTCGKVSFDRMLLIRHIIFTVQQQFMLLL